MIERGRVFVGPHGAVEIAGVNALDDAGELPVGKRDIKVDARQVAATRCRVARQHVVAVEEAFDRRRRRSQSGHDIVRAAPIHLEQTDIGHGITEGADLPVEDGHEVAGGVDHAVVEAVVAVDDGGRALLGDARAEVAVDVVDGR